ncbi:MAG: hypothetical protein LC128_13840 [Chitinophagales bacterium]|nr:hypothetical protein [Chitinophagales bacterium]
MKQIIFFLLTSFVALTACNNNAKQDKTTSGTETGTTTNPPAETTLPATDMAKALEAMKNLPALSTDQLKAMLPETLLDMKRSGFSVNSGMGFGVAEADYKNEDDSKRFRVQIFDCAGAAGAAYYSMMYWGFNMEQEDDNGYKKTVTFNGNKAVESYEKNSDQYSLLFPASNRLLVQVEGDNTGLDAVKQAANSLNLKVN